VNGISQAADLKDHTQSVAGRGALVAVIQSGIILINGDGDSKGVMKKTKELKREYQVDFSQALSKMKHHLVYMIRYAHEGITSMIRRTIYYIGLTAETIRYGRTAPRKQRNIKNDI